jgi:hypothetical protein
MSDNTENYQWRQLSAFQPGQRKKAGRITAHSNVSVSAFPERKKDSLRKRAVLFHLPAASAADYGLHLMACAL